MAWEGWFLRWGYNNSTVQGTTFPAKYINASTWDSNPNVREELKAYRDENTRQLHRVTAEGKKSSISFETRDGLGLADKMAIQEFFTEAVQYQFPVDKQEEALEQRKIILWYWNDEDNSYKKGTFYRPNMNFPIKYATRNDIKYGPLKIELIEY
ncbi:MAG: hypothetical protein IKO56_07870 [Alphaproteobacteria bacterium]|nr:hypothetical protein [Alphaproteobacteria bacterium]